MLCAAWPAHILNMYWALHWWWK